MRKIITVFVGLCLAGCTAFYISKRGDKVDLASVPERTQDCVVKVAVLAPDRYYYGPEPVLYHLKGVKAIKVVSGNDDPDFVLLVKIDHYGSASQALMLLTFITVGIFPTYYIETRDLKVEVWKREALVKTYNYERNFHVVAGLLGLLLSPLGNVDGNEGLGFGSEYTDVMGKEFAYDLATGGLLACQPNQ